MESEIGVMDDKAKRTRDLLSSFYSSDQASSIDSSNVSSRFATFDTINSTSFDPDQYMNLLVEKSNLEGLLQKHVEMATEIKNLDTDMQMLVYENYNKFISATDTIKRMKSNIVGMETNMEQLLQKITSVQSRSDGVNSSLYEKRGNIEKLHRTRNLLRKVQFIYDLPARLEKCIKSEAYADAVKFYTGAMPILKAYGDSSFQDCKRESEEAIAIITKNLQGKVFSDSESIQSRAEAVLLLKQLDFPVDNLKLKLFEKLEQFLADLHLESQELPCTDNPNSGRTSWPHSAHEDSIREFAEAIRAYRTIFPDTEQKLCNLARELIIKHFEAIHHYLKKELSSKNILAMLRVIWSDVLLMDEVLPGTSLSDYCLGATQDATKQYVASKFNHLLCDISDTLTKIDNQSNKGEEVKSSWETILETSKKAVVQGSMVVLMDLHQLLDENLELLIKLRELIVDWVQEGFQNFFGNLNDHFLLLSGKKYPRNQDSSFTEGMPGDKVQAGLVLVLAELCIFIEQSAIPKITEEIAASFSGGGARGYEYGPAFVPAEICRIFRSVGDNFLHLYVTLRTQKVSVLLKKRFTAPNWIKHKEPREVHMSVDLLIQELETVQNEVKQILPQGHRRKHGRTESNGSTTSSLSNPLRDAKLRRSNTQRARSQLLETHLAKLFKQKIEIFTKVEHTQESVLNAIIKLILKSVQEFVRLHTYNRSGFQQIQLDIQFLRGTMTDAAEDEAAVDLLLDEVIIAAAERCLDPVPLENAILDKIIQAKLGMSSAEGPSSQ
ncbi:hypothetical protein LIER_15608 [Lithospermum erythrorhizon]|uniref:Vacuolar protein sorting-associated protein 51 homolog n=1 Tax=Lithospermum erythrorhizon TaxID=34254 RepID=A0AAV3Q627_LITER